jgi:hypothetical protein
VFISGFGLQGSGFGVQPFHAVLLPPQNPLLLEALEQAGQGLGGGPDGRSHVLSNRITSAKTSPGFTSRITTSRTELISANRRRLSGESPSKKRDWAMAGFTSSMAGPL